MHVVSAVCQGRMLYIFHCRTGCLLDRLEGSKGKFIFLLYYNVLYKFQGSIMLICNNWSGKAGILNHVRGNMREFH